MSLTIRPAIRTNTTLLIGLAGASGSGKTMSALRLAQGIVGRDKPFAVIDTEARRALHYAPTAGVEPDFVTTFRFDHVELGAPFRSTAYADAIRLVDGKGYGAIVVDSFSHEHDGEGGYLDSQEEELQAMVDRALERGRTTPEWQLREALTRGSWREPKKQRKAMVQRLLQVRAHLILCLRAEDKIDFVKDPKTGKTTVVPMETVAGFKGWIPICDKKFPFELTASFILTPDKPGIPQPIKLQEQHRALFPLDRPISEGSGRLIAAWAAGGATKADDPEAEERAALLAKVEELGKGKHADVRRALWAAHVGISVPRDKASLDGLRGLRDALTGASA